MIRRQVQKINPLDLQPRKAVGVSLPFSSKSAFNLTYTTQDAIKTNIINFFLTGIGERYLNIEFGTDLRNQIFENITKNRVDLIEELIYQGLSRYFPKVVVNRLELLTSPDSNLLNMVLNYSIKNTNIEDTLSINFEQ